MNTPTPNTPANPVSRSPWRTTAYALVLLGTGFTVGAASLAFAHGSMAFGGGWAHGARIGMFQHIVHNALENVGATTEQETKIHDIIATTYTQLDKSAGDREAMRKQIFELMKAPTLDRAAIEKLRAQKIADFDAKSKTIVGAALDAAGQLTPEQRAKLVQNVEERMAHGWGPGGWGPGGHHGWGGGPQRDKVDGPADHDGHGPDDDHG